MYTLNKKCSQPIGHMVNWSFGGEYTNNTLNLTLHIKLITIARERFCQ